jgi:hypothetical protein
MERRHRAISDVFGGFGLKCSYIWIIGGRMAVCVISFHQNNHCRDCFGSLYFARL